MTDSDSRQFLLFSGKEDKKEELRDLADIIFTWSLNDIFNRNLFKNKVYI